MISSDNDCVFGCQLQVPVTMKIGLAVRSRSIFFVGSEDFVGNLGQWLFTEIDYSWYMY